MTTLILFALPTLGSSVLQSLNGSINAIWIGKFLGEAALSATANANLIMFLMIGTAFGFGMAATILVGQAIGRDDVDDARKVVGVAAFWFSLVSILVAVLGWLFTPQLLHLLDTPPSAVPLATSYLRVIFAAAPLIFFLNFFMMALRGTGDSMTPLLFMGLGAVIDVVLNPILILGLGPAPEMGIAGSATATLISQGVALVGLVIYIYSKDLAIRLRGAELFYIRPARLISKSIIAKGFPMGLQMLVISGSGVVMIGFVNSYGINTSAAYGVAAQLWSYIQMPAMAIGAAVSAMAAQNIGAGKWDRVAAITKSGISINICATSLLVVAGYLVDRFFLALFLQASSPAIPIAEHMNLIVSSSFILFGIMIVIFGTVRANGSVIPPLLIISFSVILVRIGFVIWIEPVWQADAIWWSFPISSLVSVVMAIVYYKFGGWKNASMLDTAGGESSASYENATSATKPNWISMD